MHNRYFCAAAFALAVILAGCNQAPPPPAPDTHDADVKAIRDAETAGAQALNAKDVDKFAACYADDASSFPSGAPVINGMAAIKAKITAALKPLLEDKNFSFTSNAPDKVDVAKSGDLGYTQGAWTATFTDPKSKKVLTLKEKYVHVYKKQADGSWKIVADIGNEDAPPTPVKK
jgi:uncharacterized protein (TIGR02246 family)